MSHWYDQQYRMQHVVSGMGSTWLSYHRPAMMLRLASAP